MLTIFAHGEAWVALLTLTILEIILGIDNLVFISVITSRLPVHRQKLARQLGLLLACITRLLLLGGITLLTHFTQPLFTLIGHSFSVRDLILIIGGIFLLAKATSEIHASVASEKLQAKLARTAKFMFIIIQVMFLDIIFSLDSVITAVGLAQEFIIMALAIIIAILVMIWLSTPLSRLIQNYPSVKMLALSFLLLVGLVLIADGFGTHVPRGYLYFAIAFSLFVETLNIFAGRRKSE